MRIYLDKRNIISLLKSLSKEENLPCSHLLKKQGDVIFNFSKTNEDERLILLIENFFSTGVGANSSLPKFKEIFPSRPLKSNSLNEISKKEDLTAIYLLDDDRIQLLKDRGNLLLGAPGEEIKILSSMYIEDEQFSHTLNPRNDMQNWGTLSFAVKPCSDIIIADPYICSDENLLEFNLYPLITTLASHIKNSQFNLVVITRKQVKNNWENIISQIKAKIKKSLNSKINVTFIVDATNQFHEHDRIIFTNYTYLTSGDSLNYYDSNGQLLSRVRNFVINSHGSRTHLRNSYLFLEDMQKIVDYYNRPNFEHRIFGDKKCNFLKF